MKSSLRVRWLLPLAGVAVLLTAVNLVLVRRVFPGDADLPRKAHWDVMGANLQDLNYLLHEANDPQTRVEAPQFVRMLAMAPGEAVADIGCGPGFYCFYLSPIVGSRGRVDAVDIDQGELDYVQRRARALGLTNIHTVLSRETDSSLPPDSENAALMVNLYHFLVRKRMGDVGNQERERTYIYPLLNSIVKALRPSGRLLIFDFDSPDAGVPIELAIRQVEACGLKYHRKETLPRGDTVFYTLLFVKP